MIKYFFLTAFHNSAKQIFNCIHCNLMYLPIHSFCGLQRNILQNVTPQCRVTYCYVTFCRRYFKTSEVSDDSLPIERTGDLDGRPLLSSGPIWADDDDDDTNFKYKICKVTTKCWYLMEAPGYSGYILTHQVLYFALGIINNCQSEISKMEQSIGRETSKDIVRNLCGKIDKEMELMVRQNFHDENSQDLFLEQQVEALYYTPTPFLKAFMGTLITLNLCFLERSLEMLSTDKLVHVGHCRYANLNACHYIIGDYNNGCFKNRFLLKTDKSKDFSHLTKGITDAVPPPDHATLNIEDGNATFYCMRDDPTSFKQIGEKLLDRAQEGNRKLILERCVAVEGRYSGVKTVEKPSVAINGGSNRILTGLKPNDTLVKYSVICQQPSFLVICKFLAALGLVTRWEKGRPLFDSGSIRELVTNWEKGRPLFGSGSKWIYLGMVTRWEKGRPLFDSGSIRELQSGRWMDSYNNSQQSNARQVNQNLTFKRSTNQYAATITTNNNL
ncbi:hypothetical protein GQR58_025143 [Nymphon striatum]|nr:hypothetical protein GQR58_025143 [Nymphon striatum]